MENDLKFALIFGNNKVDGKDVDGTIDRIYIDDESSHIEYVIDYLKTHFKDDSYLQNISLANTTNQIALYLKEFGHMTFYNITSYIDGKPRGSGKCGLFILPDELSCGQLEALEEFKKDIYDYNDLQVWQHFFRDESGILNCQIKSNLNTEMNVSDFIDVIIDENKQKQH